VVDSDDEFLEITATARIIIPITTANTTAFDEPPLLLDPDAETLAGAATDLVAAEIDDAEDLDDPLTGTAGIE